jgi:hypothetical protein
MAAASMGLPRRGGRYRPPRSPDAVVGWCDHQRRSQWANTRSTTPPVLDVRARGMVAVANVAIARELAGWCWSLATMQ